MHIRTAQIQQNKLCI